MSLNELEKILEQGVVGRVMCGQGDAGGKNIIFDGFKQIVREPVFITSFPKNPEWFKPLHLNFVYPHYQRARISNLFEEGSQFVYSFESTSKINELFDNNDESNVYAIIYYASGKEARPGSNPRVAPFGFSLVLDKDTYKKSIPIIMNQPELIVELFKKEYAEEFNEQFNQVITKHGLEQNELVFIGEAVEGLEGPYAVEKFKLVNPLEMPEKSKSHKRFGFKRN